VVASPKAYLAAVLEIWGDESGDLDFTTLLGSRYFITACLVTSDHYLAHDLLKFRQRLAIAGNDMPQGLHANAYPAIRNDVFRFLAGRQIAAYVSTYEKVAADTHLKRDPNSFYTMAWYTHLRAVLQRAADAAELRPFIGIASHGTEPQRGGRIKAIRRAVNKVLPAATSTFAFWPAASHPCLQAADYYAWAIQRRTEGGDDSAFRLLEHQFRIDWSQ
jgi:hypothetical protein